MVSFKLTDRVFYSQETFEQLLAEAEYSEIVYELEYLESVSSDSGTISAEAVGVVRAGLIKGTWLIPGLGQVVITTVGTVVIGNAIIAGGSWVYKKVQAYFVEKAENDYLAGTKAPKHSNQSTSVKRSLPTTGTLLSSKDLVNSQGTKQRRYYGKSGKAELDIDYRHSGNFKFPHRHTWPNGVRTKH